MYACATLPNGFLVGSRFTSAATLTDAQDAIRKVLAAAFPHCRILSPRDAWTSDVVLVECFRSRSTWGVSRAGGEFETWAVELRPQGGVIPVRTSSDNTLGGF